MRNDCAKPSDYVRITRRPGNHSLSSFIWTSAEMLLYAKVNGIKAYVDLTGKPLLYLDGADETWRNPFEWGFEQPLCVSPRTGAREEWVYEEQTWRNQEVQCPLPWNAVTPQAVAALQLLLPHVLKFRSSILCNAKAKFDKYRLNPAQTIAVSVRGAEKRVECKLPSLDEIVAAVEKWRGGMSHVWLRCETAEDSQYLQDRIPGSVVMQDFYSAPESERMSDFQNPQTGYQKAIAVLTQIRMFSMCGVLVKNPSNLGDLAAGLSTGKVVCV